MPAFAAEQPFARPRLALAGQNAARVAALVLCIALSFAALLIAQRRAAGALAVPLGPLAMLMTAAVSAGLAAAVRLPWRQLAPWAELVVRWSPTAALALLGGSLWLPGANPWVIAGYWVIAIGEESWSHRVGRQRWIARKQPAAAPFAVAAQPAALVESLIPPPTEEILADAERTVLESSEASPAAHPTLAGPHYAPPRPPSPEMCDPPHAEPSAPHFGLPKMAGEEAGESEEQVVQQLTRTTTGDGADVLRGLLYAAFSAGGRATSVHVAFCPPLRERPRIEFRQTDGPPARIKLAQLLAFGARFDIKLPMPAQGGETVALEISATFP